MSTRPVMSITDDQIAEIDALAWRATPGPWTLTLDRGLSVASNEWGLFDIRQDQPNFVVDAHYAAAANPASVLGLITRLREAERDAARYRWLLRQAWFQSAFDRYDFDDRGIQSRFELCAAEIIDAAMQEGAQ